MFTEHYKSSFTKYKESLFPIEEVYKNGKEIIISDYPEYFFADFYQKNKNFRFQYDIETLKIQMKFSHDRKRLVFFSRFTGTVRGQEYAENIRFFVSTDFEHKAKDIIEGNPQMTEVDFLTRIYGFIQEELFETIDDKFSSFELSTKSLATAYENEKQNILSILRTELFAKALERENENPSLEIVKQMPKKYFLTEDKDDLTDFEKQECIIWFLGFVYRLRNALFHAIIDPFDKRWLTIFKNCYRVLKELVDFNISLLESGRVYSGEIFSGEL